MAENPDGITKLCTFLRNEAGLSEDQMSQIDDMLVTIVAEATGQTHADIAADAADAIWGPIYRRRARIEAASAEFLERFPNSRRLKQSVY
jgi:hypothetical protein